MISLGTEVGNIFLSRGSASFKKDLGNIEEHPKKIKNKIIYVRVVHLYTGIPNVNIFCGTAKKPHR